MSTNEMSPVMEQAVVFLQQGEPLKAEELMRATANDVRASSGEGSIEYAKALYELGSVLTVLSRNVDAADVMRQAVAINIPDDIDATRDRLTYVMQLGELLEELGELDEAETVLRDGLESREEFYGRDHPGYAFGLEPLASIVFHQGRHDEALEMVEEVIDNFWRNGHPRVATAFPLRAEIMKTIGDDTPTFDGLDELSDEILSDLVAQVVKRMDLERAAVCQAVVTDLLPLVESRFDRTHVCFIHVHSMLANLSAMLGGHEGRIESIEKLLVSFTELEEWPRVVESTYGLALALSDMGDVDGACSQYEKGVAKANEIGDAAMESNGLRNWGQLYSEIGKEADAEQLMRRAVGVAQSASEVEELGRAYAAFGILLQHAGDLDQAEPMLAEAVEQLDPSDTSSLCARSHLQAIQENRSCGCGDMDSALSEAMRQYILDFVPEGLLEEVHVEINDGKLTLDVQAAGEPTDEDLEIIQRAVTQAQIEFNKRMQPRPYLDFLPEPTDATIHILENGVIPNLMEGKIEDGQTLNINLNYLESPSVRLVVELELRAHNSATNLEFAIDAIPEPDPRESDVKLLLWKYDGDVPSPGIDPPPSEIANAIAELASQPYDYEANWQKAREAGAKWELSIEIAHQLLATMVHPPAVRDGIPAKIWLPRVQLAAAQVLACMELDNDIELEKSFLLVPLFGPIDWTVDAAAIALAQRAKEKPEDAEAIRHYFFGVMNGLPQNGYFSSWEVLCQNALLLPGLSEEHQSGLTALLANIQG